MGKLSSLEQSFLFYWRVEAGEYLAPVHDFVFAPPRRFAFDFAWVDYKLAIELEGGTMNGGRHVRPKGYENDCEKYNLATLDGWRVLRYTSNMLNSDPGKVCDQIKMILDRGIVD